MALGFDVSIRNALLNQIVTRAGTSAKLRFYSGTRPSIGGTVTTLLAELTCNATQFGTVSTGVLTISNIAAGTGHANAGAGTATTWFRITASDGTTFVMDGSVTATGGGGDITLSSTTIVSGVAISINNGATITAANNT